MKYKLVDGLFGVSSNGILTTPSCKFSIKLPKRIVFWLHRQLNDKFAYVGLGKMKII